MKTRAAGVFLVLFFFHGYSQTSKPADHVIEGGKIVVELIKAISGKKELEKNPGCKGMYADLCIKNESSESLTTVLRHKTSGEICELVILPGMQECCLRLNTGVWSYDLRLTKSIPAIRKGDLLIEGCQNVLMNLKY